MNKKLCDGGSPLDSSLKGEGVLFRKEGDDDRWLEVWECKECGMLIFFKGGVDKVVVGRYAPEDGRPLNLLEGLK